MIRIKREAPGKTISALPLKIDQALLLKMSAIMRPVVGDESEEKASIDERSFSSPVYS